MISSIEQIDLAIKRLNEHLRACRLCPRECGVDRMAGELGFCRAGFCAKVFRYGPHFGEEPPLSGSRGSGTVFFSHCTMRCAYCQNHQFSQDGHGKNIQTEQLGEMMLSMQNAGCHNVNLVTATHFLPDVLNALREAYQRGLNLPIVYNTSSYESRETLELLDGIVDIYLADARYSDDKTAAELSEAPDYVSVSREALRQMWRQVGPLRLDDDGLAMSGMIIRLLLLPGYEAQTLRNLEWIAKHLSTEVAVSVMGQYRPTRPVADHPILGKRIAEDEYKHIADFARSLNFETLFIQEPDSEFPDNLFGQKMRGNL